MDGRSETMSLLVALFLLQWFVITHCSTTYSIVNIIRSVVSRKILTAESSASHDNFYLGPAGGGWASAVQRGVRLLGVGERIWLLVF